MRVSATSMIRTTMTLNPGDLVQQRQKCQTLTPSLTILGITEEELPLMDTFSHPCKTRPISKSNLCSHNLMFGTELNLKLQFLKWLEMLHLCQTITASKGNLMMVTAMGTTNRLEGHLSKATEVSITQHNRMDSSLLLEVSLLLLVQAVEVLLVLWLGFQTGRSRASMGFPMVQLLEEWHERTQCRLKWAMLSHLIRHQSVQASYPTLLLIKPTTSPLLFETTITSHLLSKLQRHSQMALHQRRPRAKHLQSLLPNSNNSESLSRPTLPIKLQPCFLHADWSKLQTLSLP